MLLLVGLYLTRAHTLNPLALAALRWAAARFAGLEVEARALRGDWLHDLTLEGLVVTNPAAHGPLRRLESDRVGVEFQLFDLVRGDLSGLHALDLGRVRAEVDLGAPPAPDSEKEREAPPAFPEWLPLVQVERLDLDLRLADGGRIVLDGAEVASRRTAMGPLFAVYLPSAELQGQQPFTTSAALHVACRGATVVVEEVTLQNTSIGGFLELDLGALPDVGWRVDVTALDGRAAGQGALSEGTLEATLLVEQLHLSHVQELFDAPWAATLSGEVDLELDLTADLSDPTAALAEVAVAGRELTYQGRRIESLTAAGDVERGVARFPGLEVRAGADHVAVRDLVVPFGDGAARLLEGIAGVLSVEVNDLSPWLYGDAPPERALPAHRVQLDASVAGGLASFTGGRVAVADGTLVVHAGELCFPSAEDPGSLELALSADFADLAPVGALLDSEGWAGSLAGRVDLSGPLDALVGRAQLAGAGVAVAGFDLGEVELDAHTDGAHVAVDAARATTDDLTFTLAGGYLFAEEALEPTTLALEVTRPHRFAELLAPGGRLEVRATASGPWRAPSGEVAVTGLDLVAAEVPVSDLTVEGVLDAGRLDVGALRCGTPYGAVDAALDVQLPLGDAALAIDLRALSLSVEGHALALTAPAPVELGEELAVGPLAFAGTAGTLDLELTLADDQLRVAAAAEALDLTPFARPLLPPEIPAVLLDLQGDYAAGRFELARLAARVDDATLLDVQASLPLDPLGETPFVPGELSVQGRVALPPGRALELGEGVALHGDVEGVIDLRGTWSALEGAVTLDAAGLHVTPEERARPFLADAAEAHVSLVLDPERVALETCEVTLPERVTLTASGDLGAGVDVGALGTGDTSSLEAARLTLDGELGFLDLAWVAELDDTLRRLAGHTRGALRVRGTAGDPQIAGELSLTEGQLKLAGVPELRALEARVAFAEEVLTVRDTRWEMGAAPVSVAGTLDLSGSSPALDLRLTGEGALLARSAAQRLRGDLDVSVTGPLDQLEVSGAIGLRHSRLLQEIDFLSALQGGGSVKSRRRGLALPSFKDGPLSSARFDLEVKTVEPVRLISNVMRGDVRVDMRIGGTGEVLVPAGRVFLDDLKARLPGGTVTFPHGLVTFEEDDPYDPRLEISGEARLAGYDVTLAVSERLSDPLIDAKADPALPGDDLMLLILTGQVPPEGAGGEAAARSLGLYVAKDLFSKWTGGAGLDEDEDSFWSRLEISSGRDVSKAGAVTYEVTYRWRDGYPGADDAVYLVAERDVYEDYNMGVRFVLRRR